MKVALVYDRVNKWGGAERVLLALHEIFPEAPLYTSVYDEKKAPWAKVFPEIYTSFLQKLPLVKKWHEGFGWLMPFAFESFDFSGYDLVISVTSEAAKGIIIRPPTRHICYCLTPTRYFWSGYGIYFSNPIIKWLSKPIVLWLRKWDVVAARRPDKMIAISLAVQERIKKYYGRKSETVFPPADSHHKNSLLRVSRCNIGKTSRSFSLDANRHYYLIVSRLVPYKKVDLAVKAFNKLKLPLVVVGSGSQLARLKLMAGKNIKFAGQVLERELAGYYAGAKALIMPQEEDFGLIAVEALSCGVPIIAFNKGGVKDIVAEGQTGLFFSSQTPASLIAAIRKFDKWHPNREQLVTSARRFSKRRFQRAFIRACFGRGRGNQALAEIKK